MFHQRIFETPSGSLKYCGENEINELGSTWKLCSLFNNTANDDLHLGSSPQSPDAPGPYKWALFAPNTVSNSEY